jgi:tetratricopeptide (TPR) repeat protein
LWFFLILAPTSSLIPVIDPAVEHRMYLPLASIVTLVVIGGWHLLRRPTTLETGSGRLALVAALTVVSLLGTLTIRRNEAYRTAVTIWRSVLAQRPHNFRARHNLGMALAEEGRLAEAVTQYTEALRLRPELAITHNNLGNVLVRQARAKEALPHYVEADVRPGTQKSRPGA